MKLLLKIFIAISFILAIGNLLDDEDPKTKEYNDIMVTMDAPDGYYWDRNTQRYEKTLGSILFD